jgi:hypothetical protein
MTPPPNFVNKAGGLKVYELYDQTMEKRILPLPVSRNR